MNKYNKKAFSPVKCNQRLLFSKAENFTGFTLIELLIVIGIIAILASAVIVAINPGQQFAAARDAARSQHINSLYNSLISYQISNQGSWGDLSAEIDDTLTEICNTNLDNPDCTDLADLSDLVASGYINQIPVDPQAEGDGTGYYIAKGSVILIAGNRETRFIGVGAKEDEVTFEDNVPSLSSNEEDYSLTVDSSSGGSGTDVTDSSPYEEGATVDIEATPDSGYEFDEWTTDDGGSFGDSTSTDTTYEMPSNEATITANFVEEGFSCGDDITFTYQGSEVTYGTINHDGQCWMDRNLGADQVATAYDDSDSYGDLFQWGRPDDGHQERDSSETSTLADSDHPGHSDFIKSEGDSPYDWRDPQNDDMWNEDGSGSNDGETCPDGWRIPSEDEWSSVSSNWEDREDAFNSDLKLPSAGYRDDYGSVNSVDDWGKYWSSSVDGIDVGHLSFSSNSLNLTGYYRAAGQSVRCLKE